MILKVCPVLLRGVGQATKILAFRHPLAGKQIVKGTVEPGESLEAAAIREMREESGIDVTIERSLGWLRFEESSQIWHVFLCRSIPCPDRWEHSTEDDARHVFSFFWHRLDQAPDGTWHADFVQALRFVAERTSDRS